eukprot:Colp12_sorted_trinity150504_noHs@34021
MLIIDKAMERASKLMDANIYKLIDTNNIQFMNVVVGILLEEGFSVYGGYVRDYIIRGEQARDIDVAVSMGTSLAEIQSTIMNHDAFSDIGPLSGKVEWLCKNEDYDRDTHDLLGTLTIRHPREHKWEISVDFVKHLQPDVDSDASNLCLFCETENGQRHVALGLFVDEEDWGSSKPENFSSIEETIHHIAEKCAVMYYKTSTTHPEDKNTKKGDFRVKKLQSAGWNVLGHTNDRGGDSPEVDKLSAISLKEKIRLFEQLSLK